LRIRLENDSLLDYLAERRALVEEFLEADCPDRKGKRYARNGAQVPADMRSVVLNQSF
jgi:hypothetical protein